VRIGIGATGLRIDKMRRNGKVVVWTVRLDFL
jgi:hypothetical protein